MNPWLSFKHLYNLCFICLFININNLYILHTDAKNERLWFKTNTKLAKLYFDINNFNKMQKVITEVKQSCQTPEGKDDMKKGSLIDISWKSNVVC